MRVPLLFFSSYHVSPVSYSRCWCSSLRPSHFLLLLFLLSWNIDSGSHRTSPPLPSAAPASASLAPSLRLALPPASSGLHGRLSRRSMWPPSPHSCQAANRSFSPSRVIPAFTPISALCCPLCAPARLLSFSSVMASTLPSCLTQQLP